MYQEVAKLLEEILRYMPVIIPLAILQLCLMVVALIHAIRHPKYKIGNMTVWIIVIIVVNIIGPVLYFVLGRGEEGEDDYHEHS